jgi:tyrosine aminotransferase
VIPALEKECKDKHSARPEKPILFTLGDPTRYDSFKTPMEYREMAANAVGRIDGYTDCLGDVDVRR